MTEIYLKRKIDNYLMEWKNDSDKKPGFRDLTLDS